MVTTVIPFLEIKMPDMASPESQATPEAVFRPHKRRRVIRQREQVEEDTPRNTVFKDATAEASDSLVADSAPPSHEIGSRMEDSEVHASDSVADLMRRRRQAKARKGGVGFSRDAATSTSRLMAQDSPELKSSALVPILPEASAIDSARDRFAPQTGTVVESSNEHM